MNTKTAEVYTFVRRTPSINIAFLASMLHDRSRDRVCLSHLDEPAPATLASATEASKVSTETIVEPKVLNVEPEVVEASFVEDAQVMAEPETAPVKVEVISETPNPVKVAVVEHDEPVTQRNLKEVWDLEAAREAFKALESSGLSKTAFAKQHGFDPGRFKRWQDRI